ncbi:MAG: MBOAT family protein [Atopobiaceae bacterium]|nr:MBOAT family protein [Atopobiaceae bacterium]
MVFSSFMFLFVFLPVVMFVYQVVPARFRNHVLLAGSLFFYAWGGPRYLLLIAGEALVSWICALVIGSSESQTRKRVALVIECVVLLGLLGYFKYTGFFLGNLHALFGVPKEVFAPILPIGISFYTFQLLSYVADVYRGEVEPQRAYWKLLLYCALFHQCIAGPIVRYKTVAHEIDERHATASDVYAGVRRFCVGLGKKVILANACATVADSLVPAGTGNLVPQPFAGWWLGMIFYTLQIYLDFSAYSDMAIGLGRMVGFHYLENFDHPYEAVSVQDFWRRWHISLSSFFRDYVYIPLGGSRCSTSQYIRNMAVVWLLTGFWHGASWNYILWGVYYLGLLLLEKFVLANRMPKPLSRVYTLVMVTLGWVLFRFENFSEMARAFGGMFGIGATGFTSLAVHTAFLQNVVLLVVSIVACTGLGSWLRRQLSKRARSNDGMLMVYNIEELAVPIVLIIVSTIALAGASYNPFIYFQF